MCGINAVWGRDPTMIERMNQALKHRGVRARALSLGDLAIGHVRLPIQGLSEDFDQPQAFGDEVWAFVGEVFNFRAMDHEAETDLPVLRDLTLRDQLDLADGFWSAIYTSSIMGSSVVFTDPLGKKPLYARMRDESTVEGISSEMAPLLCLGPVSPDDLYYSMVLKWGYCMNERTPFREIKKLEAGRFYHLNPGGRIMRTWKKQVIEPKRGNLPVLMRSAVANRTVSDVPISILLSGGLDSTIIFELLKETGVPFTVYHVDNGESEYLAHLDYPNRVSVKQLKLDDIGMNDLLKVSGVPVDLGSVLPQYLLGKAVQRDGCNVALSGDGADELFGGYRRSKDYDSQWSDVFCELPHYHLPRLDKMMMASTVELRCPYLSIPVVQHALSLPWSVRTEKQHLKESFPWIAEQILRRDKKPLKIRQVREKPMENRKKMVEMHRRMYWP